MSGGISRPIGEGIGHDGDVTVRAIEWPDGSLILESSSADSLDAAWAEAEAGLPEGWKIERLDLGAWGSWWAYAGRGPVREHGEGDTPAAALRALTARLKERAG